MLAGDVEKSSYFQPYCSPIRTKLLLVFSMDEFIQRYKRFIRSRLNLSTGSGDRHLQYWQDQLFYNFLIYCLPASFIALVPCVYVAIKDGYPVIAAIDIICLLIISLVTFSGKISAAAKKVSVISVFYFLSFFLINSLGYVGPGIFYLFFITILVALIFPVRYAYLSVGSNAAILLFFAEIIRFRLFHSALIQQYTPGTWEAFSSNLAFASIVIVILIDIIFKGLQQTIIYHNQLQEKYKSIFDKSPLPMWLFDPETFEFLDVNDAAIRHYGYNKQEFLAMTIKDLRPATDVPEVERIVKANKISEAYYDGTSQHLKKNGDLIYVQIESNLLQFNQRSARLVLATDITTQLEHQLEIINFNLRIKDSESKLRAIFESTLDGFVLLDAGFRIKMFNTKAANFMQFNNIQHTLETGRSVFDYIESRSLPYFKETIRKVFSGQTIDYARKYRKPGGSEIWIRYSLTPVYEGCKIVGACINGRDVTARKLYLKNVEEQNKTFREISWMQSHLVRAPLARIIGLMPLFIDAKDQNERAAMKNYLELSTKELDDIINQISKKSDSLLQQTPAAIEIDQTNISDEFELVR